MRRQTLDLASGKLFAVALALILLLIVIGTLMWVWQNHLIFHQTQEGVPPGDSPRAQVEFESGELLTRVHDSQKLRLESYSWCDEKREFARIPLERAMVLFLANPDPTWPAGKNP